MIHISKETVLERLKNLPGQKNPIARRIVMALTDNTSPHGVDRCQMFQRISYEHVVGTHWEFAHLPTAKKAGLAFKNTKYHIPAGAPLLPGDLLYKCGPKDKEGHVGCLLDGGLIADNSEKYGDKGEFRGLCTQKEFGAYTIAVRWPDGLYQGPKTAA